MNVKKLLSQLLGWYGAAAILLAYFLLSSNYLTGDSLLYHGLNFTGSIGLLVVTLQKKDFQPAVVNAIFAIIALYALGVILF